MKNVDVENDYNLNEKILVKFGSVNGIEIIEQIISRLNEMDHSIYTKTEIEEINATLQYADIIRTKFSKL